MTEKAIESEKSKSAASFTIQTDHVIEARRPDTVALYQGDIPDVGSRCEVMAELNKKSKKKPKNTKI